MEYANIQGDVDISPDYQDNIADQFNTYSLYEYVDRFFDGNTYDNPDPKAYINHLMNVLQMGIL